MCRQTASRSPKTNPGGKRSPIAALAIGGVKISNARIRWRDQQSDTDAVLRDFNLSIGEVHLHELFPLELAFVFKDKGTGLIAELSLVDGNVKRTIEVGRWPRFLSLSADGSRLATVHDAGPVRPRLRRPLQVQHPPDC